MNREIQEKEHAEIAKRRKKLNLYDDKTQRPILGNCPGRFEQLLLHQYPEESPEEEPPPKEPDQEPLNRVGLAISGGGIRSATFSLGIVQYLAEKGVFRWFDYLSTVSGGGFLGSCITSWYTQSAQRQLNPEFPFKHDDKIEPSTFQHLRNFSNYLTPSGSPLDQMRMLALFVRGLIINLMMVLPFMLFGAAGLVWYLETIGYTSHIDQVVWDYLYASDSDRGLLDYLDTIGATFNWSQFLAVVFATVMIGFTLGFSLHISPWRTRDQVTRNLFGLMLVGLGLIFFVELQPVAMFFYRVIEQDLVSGGNLVGSVGVLSSLFYFFVDQLKDSGPSPGEPTQGNTIKKGVLLFLVYLLVPLFFWGWLLFLAQFGLSLLDPMKLAQLPDGLEDLIRKINTFRTSGDVIGVYLTLGVLTYIPGFFININRYSLHVFYRDRLSRAYLIGPRSVNNWRNERPVFEDDTKLSALNFETSPYHLINAAVNVTEVDDNDTAAGYISRGRKADFFLFSKHGVGSEITGYCPTTEMEAADPWLNLGTAMAISGAAFSPNMGVFTDRTLTALMTFFNVRLGYWLPNPKIFDPESSLLQQMARQSWSHPPRKYLFNEAFSTLSVDKDAYINVSDGGHIENLAIYPLLQRRCRLIIALDGEQDVDMRFEGLAATIRLARINLNVHIEMADLQALCAGTQHHAEGTIYYPEGMEGKLVYIKASLCGHENLYIKHYKANHKDFPHETTMDQFFDEEQFECYRALGHHVASEVFGGKPSGNGVPLPGMNPRSACAWSS